MFDRDCCGREFQLPSFDLEFPLRKINCRKPAIFSKQLYRHVPLTVNFPLSTFHFQLSTYNLQLTTYNLQLTTYNLQLTTYNFPTNTFPIVQNTLY